MGFAFIIAGTLGALIHLGLRWPAARKVPGPGAIVASAFALLTAPAAFAVAQSAPVDYASPDSWLARPGLGSPAQRVPEGSGYRDLQVWARADAFYIHPTTGMRDDVDNVLVDDPQALAVGQVMLTAQATPFNGVARIYAPRYRQAALHVFEKSEAEWQAPLNLAYEDVRRAFHYFLEHDNAGRPFFLVAHSQGSNHALRLLVEEIARTDVERRMVAAYIPGMPTPQAFLTKHLPGIPLCSVASQVGCVAVWGVFAEGYQGFEAWEALNVYWDPSSRRWVSARGMDLANVNPVSWSLDTAPAPRHWHLGAVPFGVHGTNFSGLLRRLVSARSQHGYTIVAPAPLPGAWFNDGGVFEEGNYHVFDISLFWADIRANARQRLATFLGRGKQAGPLVEGPVVASLAARQSARIKLHLRNGPSALHADGLPPGMRLDAQQGEISGTPEQEGQYVVVLTAEAAAPPDGRAPAGGAGSLTDVAELIVVVD